MRSMFVYASERCRWQQTGVSEASLSREGVALEDHKMNDNKQTQTAAFRAVLSTFFAFEGTTVKQKRNEV